MSKQYDVDDILNEIKAKKARQNASQSARAGRGSPAARPKPVNQNIEDLSSQAYRQPQPEPVTPTKTDRPTATGSTGCFIRAARTADSCPHRSEIAALNRTR